MGKVKVGVFGAGRGMSAVHQLFENPDAELVAVCDWFKPALDDCRKEAEEKGLYKIAYYESFDEFIQHDMDAVILANYAHEHAKFGIRLLKSGRHIMSECLTMANMAEAIELIETVEQTGKVYSYAENYCYTPARWEMRELYRSGKLGELLYAEGEYIHDCSSIWPQITYGQRDHWRNRESATFYCTHSVGPILYMTGLRPVQVTAFATPGADYMRELGRTTAILGVEMLTLENGAVIKSVHGDAKSYRHSRFEINCTRGSAHDLGEGELGVYIEGPNMNCRGERKVYKPEPVIAGTEKTGHGGADFYTTHYFIQSILGDPVAKERTIGVYDAVEYCMAGVLGYRSIVNNSTPMRIPNLRNKEEREPYRYDTFCTFKECAGNMCAPINHQNNIEIPDSVYEEVERRWKAGEPG